MLLDKVIYNLKWTLSKRKSLIKRIFSELSNDNEYL